MRAFSTSSGEKPTPESGRYVRKGHEFSAVIAALRMSSLVGDIATGDTLVAVSECSCSLVGAVCSCSNSSSPSNCGARSTAAGEPMSKTLFSSVDWCSNCGRAQSGTGICGFIPGSSLSWYSTSALAASSASFRNSSTTPKRLSGRQLSTSHAPSQSSIGCES